jgi:excisionase family DNA binding protein
MSEPASVSPKWYTVAQVAQLLGYGESKVRMLIIAGDLRSLKDGRARRILPAWVDEIAVTMEVYAEVVSSSTKEALHRLREKLDSGNAA